MAKLLILTNLSVELELYIYKVSFFFEVKYKENSKHCIETVFRPCYRSFSVVIEEDW